MFFIALFRFRLERQEQLEWLLFRKSDVLCSGAAVCSELESVGEVSRLLTGSAVCRQKSGGQQTVHHGHWSALPTCRVSQWGWWWWKLGGILLWWDILATLGNCGGELLTFVLVECLESETWLEIWVIFRAGHWEFETEGCWDFGKLRFWAITDRDLGFLE